MKRPRAMGTLNGKPVYPDPRWNRVREIAARFDRPSIPRDLAIDAGLYAAIRGAMKSRKKDRASDLLFRLLCVAYEIERVRRHGP